MVDFTKNTDAAADVKLLVLEQAIDASHNEPEGYDLSERQYRDLFGGDP